MGEVEKKKGRGEAVGETGRKEEKRGRGRKIIKKKEVDAMKTMWLRNTGRKESGWKR